MANVKPFRALRFNQENAGKIENLCCPPYDIIPDASVWTDRSKYNIISLEKPAENGYQAAAKLLSEWRSDNILELDKDSAFYLYEEEFDDDGTCKIVYGLMGHVELVPFSAKIVLPHENTLSKAKQDRYDLMMATKCHFSPVYSMYEDKQKILAPIYSAVRATSPEVELTMPDGIIHRLWAITDLHITQTISDFFADKKLYIADGHHRYETSVKVREELGDAASPYVMMMLTDLDHDGLVVYPTHRMLANLDNFSYENVVSQLSDKFDVVESNELDNNSVVFITKDKTVRLTLKDSSFNGLDVDLLHNFILEPVFGINPANMANQSNLTYTRDASEAVENVSNGNVQCAFLLNPTKVSQIRDVAIAGGKMPQKSTYFQPKLITGLLVNDFNA